MKPPLDLKDRKILLELDADSRQSNARIAKRTGLSKQVVGFRIARLLREGMVRSFYTVIDIAKLGYTNHKVFLRLQDMEAATEAALVKFLQEHESVVWAVSCDGQFDLAFGTRVQDMEQLEQLLKQLTQRFGAHIAERSIATIIRGEYFWRQYLAPEQKERTLPESAFGSVPAPAKLDEKDWKILVRIAEDARASSVAIGAAAGLSADAVAQRIRKLEQSGVIQRSNIVPGPAFPYLHYKVLFRLRDLGASREAALLAFCKRHPNIVYVVKALGPWDFETDIEVESVERFREVMMELKTRFADVIRDYSPLTIYQIHKYNFCPSSPAKI